MNYILELIVIASVIVVLATIADMFKMRGLLLTVAVILFAMWLAAA